jgi:hypothetical protein
LEHETGEGYAKDGGSFCVTAQSSGQRKAPKCGNDVPVIEIERLVA